ncbi:hypothetical protein POTOM_004946 [Populus tomentosa]|uniref:Uncharacterized protein n=1 Tax=Populus tomentosa TaxID=118781 RepID=A0A8X8ARD3_POPTO|nr:hypothetical protein POTOM_004946 [Populus tomentosa]
MDWGVGSCLEKTRETAFVLQALSIPTNTNLYLAAGDGLVEIEGLKPTYTNAVTKSALLRGEDLLNMRGNTRAALDYYVSINSQRAYAELTSKGLKGKELLQALWVAHKEDSSMGKGSALPDCFCETVISL